MNALVSKAVKLLKILGTPGYWRPLLDGVAAGVEHSVVLKLVDFRTIIDVGANRGQFALVAHEHCPKAKIFSFEPLPIAANTFRSIFRGRSNVTLFEYALGKTAGAQSIHVSNRDDSSSLLPITSLQNQIFPGTQQSSEQSIQVAKLSDLLKPEDIVSPSLVKLDVQGYELQVLEGASDYFRHFDYIYVECSFVELYQGQPLASEIIGLLAKEQFRILGVYNVSYDSMSRAIQADFLFAKVTA